MQSLIFSVQTLKETENYAQFAIEPLENGFGQTLGNALRRVLLANFRGAAITNVKISGVTHKFSTLSGMSEDMIDLMLNLKEVKVSYEGDTPVTAKLVAKGPGIIKAKEIIAPPSIKIVTPDLPIAKLAAGAKLNMELTIETGYGYSPAESRSSDVLGLIPLDALFSPVERVSYQVESTRVGRRTDFDRLVLDLYTDGTQSPLSILQEASRLLAAYFTQIYSPQVTNTVVSDEAPSAVSLPLEELGLPVRITNALKQADYHSAGDLLSLSDKELKVVRNFGGKSITLLDEALAKKGLSRH